MSNKVILENGGMPKFISGSQKNQKTCNEAVDNCAHAEFVPDCHQTQKMCDKTVGTYPSAIQFVPDRYKTQ